MWCLQLSFLFCITPLPASLTLVDCLLDYYPLFYPLLLRSSTKTTDSLYRTPSVVIDMNFLNERIVETFGELIYLASIIQISSYPALSDSCEALLVIYPSLLTFCM